MSTLTGSCIFYKISYYALIYDFKHKKSLINISKQTPSNKLLFISSINNESKEKCMSLLYFGIIDSFNKLGK